MVPAHLARISHRDSASGPPIGESCFAKNDLAVSGEAPRCKTDCNPDLFGFARVEGREVVASFDGGAITTDAGALLLGATDRAIRLVEWLTLCFQDARAAELIEHQVGTLVGQRVFGIALGYEDLNDHDKLRHDPVMAVLAGKLKARRRDCAAVAGKSTLNRLELSQPGALALSQDQPSAGRPLRSCSLVCSWRPTPNRRSRSSSISTPPTIRCTAIRKTGSSTAMTIATAICRFMCSAADICWPRSCGGRTSTAPPDRSRRWHRSLAKKSAKAGRGCRYTCCGPTAAFAERI